MTEYGDRSDFRFLGCRYRAMTWFFAFLHRIAAFTLVAAVVVEFALIRDELTVENARKVQRADLVLRKKINLR